MAPLFWNKVLNYTSLTGPTRNFTVQHMAKPKKNEINITKR